MHQSVCKLVACCDVPLPAGHKYVAIQLLTEDTLNFVVDAKSSGQELFDLACESLKLSDTKLFGLAVLIDGEFHFLDLQLKLSKHMHKIWKSSNENGLNDLGVQGLVFYFRVQFYVDCHHLLRERTARHYYYLQLRENVITYGQALSVEKAFLLAALALQADLGNFTIGKHFSSYFDPKKYFPPKIINRLGLGYIEQHTPTLHKDYFGLNRGEAQILYMRESSEEATPHNLHLYKITRRKTKESVLWLGISFSGIQFYEESKQLTKRRISLFCWSDISRLYFNKKKFGIRFNRCPKPWTLTYYTSSDDLSRSLLWLCRAAHQFYMFIEPQVKEIQRRISSSHKQYRESYIYSNSLDLAWEKQQRKAGSICNSLMHISPLKKEGSSGSDNCVSVISNTSSNTTSGIASEKNNSHDESEVAVHEINRSPIEYNPEESQEFETFSILPRNNDNSQCENLRSTFNSSALYKCCCTCCLHNNCSCSQTLGIEPYLVERPKAFHQAFENKAVSCKSLKYENLQETIPVRDYGLISNNIEAKFCSKDCCRKCNCKAIKSLKIHPSKLCNDSSIPIEMKHTFPSKTFIYRHIRNTTKIGVSSLSRIHGFRHPRLDCTILSASSEPSLHDCASCYYVSNKKKFPLELSSLPIIPGTGEQHMNGSQKFGSTLSETFSSSESASESEMSTAVNETKDLPSVSWCSKERLALFPSLATNFLGNFCYSSDQVNDVHRLGSLPVLPLANGEQHNSFVPNSFSNTLDLHQLRQKSNNVDFSLLSSLCNDRSLLMLPKTVPTCSRQRHIGKDYRRFSCSALLADLNETFPSSDNQVLM